MTISLQVCQYLDYDIAILSHANFLRRRQGLRHLFPFLMSKKLLSVFIPISAFVLFKVIFLSSPSSSPDHSSFLSHPDSIKNTSAVTGRIFDDVSPCFMDSAVSTIEGTIRIKAQIPCDGEPFNDYDENTVKIYTKNLDSITFEVVGISTKHFLRFHTTSALIDALMGTRIIKGRGHMDSMTRVKINGIDGVKELFESDKSIGNGDTSCSYHLTYCLVLKGHIIEIDYFIAGKKNRLLDIMLYFNKYQPIFEDMIERTQLHVV